MSNDTLFRNGHVVREPFAHIEPSSEEDVVPEAVRTWGPVVVDRETVFVLGDNRHRSKDSRHVGLIPIENLVGTPRVVYYSYDPEADTPLPALTAIRWARLGLALVDGQEGDSSRSAR